MDKLINWIKSSVQICIQSEGKNELTLKDEFRPLEELYKQFSDEERQKICEIMKSQFSLQDCIYVVSFFVEYMEISDFHSFIMDLLIENDCDVFTANMLELQVTSLVNNNYEKKKILHDINVKRMEDIFSLKYPYIPVENRNRKRIVIITEQLISEKHAPTKIILETVMYLQKYLDYEVLLFVCPLDARIKEGVWNNNKYINSVADYSKYTIQREYGGTVINGYQINLNEHCIAHYHMMYRLIYEFNPFFVWNYGTFNPADDLCRSFTTIVYKSMTVDLGISSAQIQICNTDTKNKYKGTEYEKEQKLCDIMIRYPIIADKAQKVYSKKELGFDANDFVIAIVGNRLDSEVSDDFLAFLSTLVDENNRLKFAVIGETTNIQNRIENTVLKEHVQFLGYCSDLSGVYQALDMYLNPHRKGGGYSSVYALQNGLPVVTFPDCDVAYHSPKIFVMEDYEQMKKMICDCATNPEYHKELSKIAVEHSTYNSFEKAAEDMEEMIQKLENAMKELEND